MKCNWQHPRLFLTPAPIHTRRAQTPASPPDDVPASTPPEIPRPAPGPEEFPTLSPPVELPPSVSPPEFMPAAAPVEWPGGGGGESEISFPQ